MTDTALRELLASHEQALTAADRAIKIARAFAEAHRMHITPPPDVVDAYLARIDTDERQLANLRERARQFKSMLSA